MPRVSNKAKGKRPAQPRTPQKNRKGQGPKTRNASKKTLSDEHVPDDVMAEERLNDQMESDPESDTGEGPSGGDVATGAETAKPGPEGIWRWNFTPLDLLTDDEKIEGQLMKKLPAEAGDAPDEAAKNLVPSLRKFEYPHVDADNSMAQPTDPKKLERRRQEWMKSKNPPGHQILEKLATRSANLRTVFVCGYNTFADTDCLNSFCDNVVCHILQPTLRCYFGGNPMLPFEGTVDSWRGLENVEQTLAEPNPQDVLLYILRTPELRRLLKDIAEKLTRPVCLPITNQQLSITDLTTIKVDMRATAAVAALQLLLFSPTDWDRSRVYSKDRAAYEHRYPTPLLPVEPSQREAWEKGPGEPIVGDFPLEDFGRALSLIVYTGVRRHHKYTQIHTVTRTSRTKQGIRGYYNPLIEFDATDRPNERQHRNITDRMSYGAIRDRLRSAVRGLDETINAETPARKQLQEVQTIEDLDRAIEEEEVVLGEMSTRFDEEVTSARTRQATEADATRGLSEATWAKFDKWLATLYPTDHDDLDARTLERTLNFTSHVESPEADAYLDQVRRSDLLRGQIGEDVSEERLLRQYRNSFVVSLNLTRHHPPAQVDWDRICAEAEIDPDTLSMHPGTPVQPLLPHQVADLGRLIELDKRERSVVLSLAMGLGKTKLVLALVEYHVRALVRENATLEPAARKPYLPSLFVNPSQTIHQALDEAVRQHPGMRVLYYYGSALPPGVAEVGNVRHVKRKEWQSTMERLMRQTDRPETGRTIILSTWRTLSARLVKLCSQRFRFVDAKTREARKELARTVQDDEDDESEPEDDEDMDDDDEDGGERQRQRPTIPEADEAKEQMRRLHRYTADDCLDETEIEILKAGSKKVADGNLVTVKPTDQCCKGLRLQYVLLDEAHVARRTFGTQNQMVRVFDCKQIIWITGTPRVTSNRDIESFATAIFRKLGINGRELRDQIANADIGDAYGLWHEAYDPYSEYTWYEQDAQSEAEQRTTKPILGPSSPLSDELKLQIEAVIRDQDLRPWIVCTHLLAWIGYRDDFSYAFGHHVVSSVIDTVCLQRSLQSRLLMRDGTATFPGLHVPPMTVRTEHVEYTPRDQVEVRDFGRFIARNASRASEDTLSSVAPGAMQPVGEAPARQMNFGSFRVGVIATYDIRTLRILNRARPDAQKSRGDEHLRGMRSKLSNSSVNPPTQSEVDAAERERQRNTRVEIGTDHVFELIQGDKLGGLQYFLDIAGTDRGVLTMDTPLAWLVWLCDASPILTRVTQLVRRHTQRRERIVVFVDTPWIQQMIFAALTVAGFEVRTNRSTDKQSKRARDLRDFQSPDGGVQVFVANLNITSTGVNLQEQCHTGILINLPHSAQTVLQVHGRIHRIGQRRPTTWYHVLVKDSYHDHQEQTMTGKWSRQLSASVNLPPWVSSMQRQVIIFEYQRCYQGSKFNRLAWETLKDMDPETFEPHGDLAEKLGHAYSCFALALIGTRPDDHERIAFFARHDDDIQMVLTEAARMIRLRELERLVLLDPDELFDILRDHIEGASASLAKKYKENKNTRDQRRRVKEGTVRRLTKSDRARKRDRPPMSDDSDDGDDGDNGATVVGTGSPEGLTEAEDTGGAPPTKKRKVVDLAIHPTKKSAVQDSQESEADGDRDGGEESEADGDGDGGEESEADGDGDSGEETLRPDMETG